MEDLAPWEKSDKVIEPNAKFCCDVTSIAKWIILVLTCVVLGLVVAEAYDDDPSLVVKGEEFTVIVCVLTLVLLLSYLTVYFLGLERSWCFDCKCFYQVAFFNIIATVLWFAAAGVETHAAIFYLDRGNIYRYRRRASAAAFSFLIAVIFGALAFRSSSLLCSKKRRHAYH